MILKSESVLNQGIIHRTEQERNEVDGVTYIVPLSTTQIDRVMDSHPSSLQR
jgi:hypothetical protein